MKIVLLVSVLMLSACSNYIDDRAKKVIEPSAEQVIEQLTKSSIGESINNSAIKGLPAGELLSVASIQKDLAQLTHYLDTIHVDPSYTMDIEQVKTVIKQLSNSVKQPMTQYEAWKHLSLLNPLFNDAHMLIGYPNFSQIIKQHLAEGGRLFPVKVRIDNNKRLFVTQMSKSGVQGGDEITAINGVPTLTIVNKMLDRMYGDSPEHRVVLAAERFSKLYWMLFGDTGTYQLDVIRNQKQSIVFTVGESEIDFKINPPLSEIVQRKILDNDIGYIKVDRFYYSPEQESGFFEFMNETWKVFHQAKVQDVIIDVRNNPGGTDHYWMQGIAPFVANKAFTLLSGFKVRLTERNLRLGPIQGELGAVKEGALEYLIPVDNDNPYHIPGKAYLLMGPLSYSSTHLFLTAMQDAKQALVVADKNNNSARSCTTGRIETMALMESKLEVVVPTAIFIRPEGADMCKQPIKPDIHLAEDLTDPTAVISTLTTTIVAKRK
jgi:C-terminal processing protease CtpA/Prc